MHGAIDVILVAVHAERAELGLYRLLGDALHRALLLQPIADQVGDRADLQLVKLRELFQIRTTRHGAIVVEDLDDRRGRLETREAREIATCFGVARARQHAAGLRHQRKDVSGLPQILGPGIAPHCRADGLRAIVRGNAGRHALGRFDGDA